MHQLPPKTVLSAISAAVEAANRESIDIVVSIVDTSGHPVGSLAMPDSFLASNEYAFWKAWTAASFKMSTPDFSSMLDKQDQHVRDGLLSHDKVTALPGGLPIFKGNLLIGAIGVSGGTAAQDETCAAAALTIFNT